MKPLCKISMGHESVNLTIRSGSGGEFTLDTATITIGIDYDDRQGLLDVLLHETMEYVLTRKGLRYYPCVDMANDQGAYVFMLNHAQFSDCCGAAAMFLLEAEPKLTIAWQKKQKTKK